MYNNFKQKTICSQQHLTCRYIKALCIFAMSLHTIMMIVYMYMCTINPTPTINSSIKKKPHMFIPQWNQLSKRMKYIEHKTVYTKTMI